MSFFGNLFGGRREEKKKAEITAAENKASGTIGSGYDAASDLRMQGLGKATGYYDDAIQTGKDAMGAYRAALGMDGAASYGAARDAFTGSDYFKGILQSGREAIEGSKTLGGELYSGNTLKELQDYGGRAFGDEWNRYIGQLGGLLGYGQQAAGAAAGQTLATYNAAAGDEIGRGSDLSNIYLQSGAARADSTNTTDYGPMALQLGIDAASMAMGMPPMGSMTKKAKRT